MPTGVYQRKRPASPNRSKADSNHNSYSNTSNKNNHNGLNPDDPLCQLQQAVLQDASASASTVSRPSSLPPGTPGQAIDGARKPIAPGAEYTSLRKITRRLPEDPEHVLDGVDTTHADLSWTAREDGGDINPATGEPWLFPKKRGKKVGSNLEDFKDEIEERTKNGQGCKAISEALVAKGVDTSSRAVARQRMKWGLRQRAPRRMTEQGIANIRKAHLELAKRMANSDPVPVKRVRIRVMRKAEITRMTKEGMTPAEIAKNLEARGVKLKRGAATIERLRTVWGLVPDSQRNINNVRQFCRNQAMRLQKEQFENIARELGIEDVNTWVKSKMDEEVALDARREHAYKLMGDLRPKQTDPSLLRRNAQNLRHNREKSRPQQQGAQHEGHLYPQQGAPAGQHDAPLASGNTNGTAATERAEEDGAELSIDEDELDSIDGEDDRDGDGADKQQTSTAQNSAEAQQSVPTTMDVDQSGPIPPQHPPPGTQSLNQAPPPGLPSGTPLPPQSIGQGPVPMPSSNTGSFQVAQQAQATPGQVVANSTVSNAQNGVGYSQQWQRRNPEPGQPGFDGAGFAAAGQQVRPAESYNTAPFVPAPFQPPSQGWLEPRSLGPLNQRPIAPRPPVARPLAPRPIAPRLPAVNTPPGEAELMAKYGLFPYATYNKAPQKYLTPKGLITTEGYEYLPNAPPPPGMTNGCQPIAPAPLQFPPQVTMMTPNYASPPPFSNGHPIPPDVIMVPPPPPPKVSKIPAPPLVIPPEEVEKHKEDYKTIEQYQKVTQECLDFLAARANGRPLLGSLTGMPPSLKDITTAKERLKEAANAMLEAL
ncbi:hypothetical protein SLS53_007212 [Cytospora paraplurivora]|uniref:Uncharacterized protein n=1 Tax=Cytospora paraplurivora TaxID=2898453 RepID=A0AAN9YE17_9PEZI